MPFEKGHARLGGRKKKEEKSEISQGTLNAVGSELDVYFKKKYHEDLYSLDEEKRLKHITSIMPFFFARLSSVDTNQTLNLNITKEAFLINGENFYLDGIAPKTIDITPIHPKQIPHDTTEK